MKRLSAYSIAFAILISLAACTPATLVVPEISYKTTEEIRAGQPDCTAPIMYALDFPGRETMLEAFWCYDRAIQYWQDEYEVLEAQLDSLHAPEGDNGK